jgi:hypothetical protein
VVYVTADLDNLLTAFYVLAADLLPRRPRVRRRPQITDAELVVRPEQVVQAADGCLSAEGLVSSAMVVLPEPAVKGACAFG